MVEIKKIEYYLLTSFLLITTIPSIDAILQCCEQPNIVINMTMCYDESNVTVLTCKYKNLIGPTMDYPEIISIDENDNLLITNDEEVGFIVVESDKYCMTKDLENDTDLALVCFQDELKMTTEKKIIFYWIDVLCAFISVIFLVMVLVIYMFIPDLQDIEGKCILNFIAGLCVEHLTVMLLPITIMFGSSLCNTNAFVYYASAIFCYIWLSVLSFHMWRITIRPIFMTQMNWMYIYCCYGYGLSSALILTALISHYALDITLQSAMDYDCFLFGSTAIWSYFYGPLLIILVIIIVPISWAAKRLWINIDRRDNSQSVVRLRTKCRMYGHLIFIIGISIIIDAISYVLYEMDDYLNIILDILEFRNLLIGCVVFFVFVVLRNKVLIALSKRGLFCMKFPRKWAKLVDYEREEVDNEEANLTRFSTNL